MIFSVVRPTGILRFDMVNLERKDDDNKWVLQRGASVTPRSRKPLIGKRVLRMIDDDIRKGKTPRQCLTGSLKDISGDQWLTNLQSKYPDVKTFGDIADGHQEDHEAMFARFKAAWYRRRTKLNINK